MTLTIRPADHEVAPSPRANETLTGSVHQNFRNGSYVLTYVPHYAGKNQMDVYVNGESIRDSPFTVVVSDGAAKGHNSTVYGDGLHQGMAGFTAHFTIQSTDEHGNFRTGGGDPFVVSLVHDEPSLYSGTVVAMGNNNSIAGDAS